MRWVDPAFAQYPLGERYTGWIYGDPQSNPAYWEDSSKWPHSGYAAFQDREIRTVLTGGNPTQTVEFNLTGGKNCIVFARYASVSFPGDSNTQKLPTQLSAYVGFNQRLVEGYFEVQDTSLSNVFGFGWSPHTFPAPITWNDKLRRTFTLSVPSGLPPRDGIVVVLGWKLAFLNTGA
jgi:hypothetical protein